MSTSECPESPQDVGLDTAHHARRVPSHSVRGNSAKLSIKLEDTASRSPRRSGVCPEYLGVQ